MSAFKIEKGVFAISLTDPAVTDPCLATIATFDDFSCQVINGRLEPTSNVTDETTPGTWCDPEVTTPKVGETSYAVVLSILQDPDITDGLSQTLFDHDTEVAWVFLGLNDVDPPKAVCKVRLVAGAIGGEARTALTADVTLPCDGKPLVCWGTGGAAARAATTKAPAKEPVKA